MSDVAMTTVELEGELGRRFGREHTYVLETAAEAIKALSANFAGFRAYLIQNSRPGYTVYVDGKDESAEEIALHQRPKTIRIVPVLEGGAKSPMTQIVIGVVLIAISVAMPASAPGTMQAFMASAAMGIGLSMTLGGIAQIIAGDPALTSDMMSPSEDKPAMAYDGPQNVAAQGARIPVVYGIVEVGSVVGSFGFYAEEFNGDTTDMGVGFRIIANGVTDEVLPLDDDGVPAPGLARSISIALSAASGTAPYTWELLNVSVAVPAGANLHLVGTTLVSNSFPVPAVFSCTIRVTDATGEVAERSLNFDYQYQRVSVNNPTLSTEGS